MKKEALAPDQEALARELADELEQAISSDLLDMARTLVDSDDEHLFGDTELSIRDQLFEIGRLLYQKHLEQKKTATTPLQSSAHTTNEPPTSKHIDLGTS